MNGAEGKVAHKSSLALEFDTFRFKEAFSVLSCFKRYVAIETAYVDVVCQLALCKKHLPPTKELNDVF
jgi:hypothetical protein